MKTLSQPVRTSIVKKNVEIIETTRTIEPIEEKRKEKSETTAQEKRTYPGERVDSLVHNVEHCDG